MCYCIRPWKRIYATSRALLLYWLNSSEAYPSGILVWRSVRLEISLLFFCDVIYYHSCFKIVLFKVHFEMAVLSRAAW